MLLLPFSKKFKDLLYFTIRYRHLKYAVMPASMGCMGWVLLEGRKFTLTEARLGKHFSDPWSEHYPRVKALFR